MQINSINTTSNQQFGMAKFANPRVMEKLTNLTTREDALALIKALPKSGCKNTNVVDFTTDGSSMPWPRVLDISFPKKDIKNQVRIKYTNCLFDAEQLATDMAIAERDLAEKVMYSAAQKGTLDKTKAELLEDLPELAEHINKYCQNSGIAEINENALKIAKAREAYKKAHPILSIFHIPKNIS